MYAGSHILLAETRVPEVTFLSPLLNFVLNYVMKRKYNAIVFI
jgi:hypothetical protein